MNFSTVDLIVAFAIGCIFSFIIYDCMLTKSILLLKEQQENLQSKENVNTKYLETLAKLAKEQYLKR